LWLYLEVLFYFLAIIILKNKKLLYMSTKDELTVSLSKSMTINDIQKELKASNIDFSAAKKKSDYVSLYITSGLHNKEGRLSAIPEERSSSVKDEETTQKHLVEKLPENIQSITVLEELVMSISIMGHGCEDLMTPWPSSNPISAYFKNNVRVYSRSCVPDVNAIGNIFEQEDILRDVQRRFSAVPKGETAAIVSAYADEVRDEYIRDIAFAKMSKDPVSLTPGFDKVFDINNLSRVSGLSTFLCNKNFSFYMSDKKEKVPSLVEPAYKTIGIQVTDIRLRKTAMDGSISYEQIFNPSDIKYIRGDRSDFNLIYKSGVTHMLKDIIGRQDLVKPALEILGFGKKNRVMDVSLEQIYNFFQLLGIQYANIMDYTCRACSVGRMSQDLTNKIYSVEQRYSIKPVAFGLSKRSKKRKVKSKRVSNVNNKMRQRRTRRMKYQKNGQK